MRTLLVAVPLAAVSMGSFVLWMAESHQAPRKQLVGPVTSGGAPALLPPPTDGDVLNALGIAGGQTTNPRVVQQLVQQYTDPLRTYPLVGPAVLHHAVYECRVRDGWTSRVIYIDHNHLHVVDQNVAVADRVAIRGL